MPEPEIIPEQEQINPPAEGKLSKLWPFILSLIQKIKIPALPISRLNHKRKIFLTLSLIIFLILTFSIFSAVKKQADAKRAELFAKIYPPAEKKYEEGQSLADLNKSLARDSFSAAQKMLEEGQSNFSKKSKEEKQISDLLAKVNKGLDENSPEKIAANLDRTKITIRVENGSGQAGVAGKASDFLKGKGYNVASTGNADNYKYTDATIKVKSSTSAYLNILKKDLSEKYTISSTSSDLPKDSTADAVIIIGK